MTAFLSSVNLSSESSNLKLVLGTPEVHYLLHISSITDEEGGHRNRIVRMRTGP